MLKLHTHVVARPPVFCGRSHISVPVSWSLEESSMGDQISLIWLDRMRGSVNRNYFMFYSITNKSLLQTIPHKRHFSRYQWPKCQRNAATYYCSLYIFHYSYVQLSRLEVCLIKCCSACILSSYLLNHKLVKLASQ